ncbi:hypothetical protein HETIRDRAFT_120744 [Heterobasidion irregulare TC 32-1]|uniref:Uncharacterized protein n=1 Tax=Heterobasidion irregulare (strain TC 32-1) TaxID=747525 RepID=W4KBK2_HETIT|nr:uncharacterized protein HETIRDRAFT_120744 [Heterobasidion irregulare TC 32-1]ETW82441.1 hypothetical protein HETIRDRAFT_120744 [Heterobasidion irregulare TC 32-1]
MPYRPPPSNNSDSDMEHSRYVSNLERAVSKRATEDAHRTPKSMAQHKGKKPRKDTLKCDNQDVYKSAACWIPCARQDWTKYRAVMMIPDALLMIFICKRIKGHTSRFSNRSLTSSLAYVLRPSLKAYICTLITSSQMIKSSSNVRTVDTTHMKKFVAEYAALDLVMQPLKLALVLANKCDRGFSHLMLNKLKSNEIKVLVKHWPAFVYKDYQYNPSDRKKGLFHGHLLICAWCAIYIGPSAARLGPNSNIWKTTPLY